MIISVSNQLSGKVMNLIEKIFAIRKIQPFDQLRDSELSLFSKRTRERRYQPGQPIASTGTVLPYLIIVLEGRVESDSGIILPPIIGITSLLYERPLSYNLIAHPNEETMGLIVNKENFFTFVYECPSFVIGMIQCSWNDVYV